ncbi:glycosyltransferase [Bizionia psychrotolerans]|uniref:glycosyltransferase n=1 Tax=Bizionia psychrotolerans TaxID=1492901 RepID=UPI00069F8398|nr:glycosyltransferase [Bizionia psychrotolerans]
MRTLTIISHTEHYLQDDGTLVGLGSTVTEINELLHVFDTITHVAMLHDCDAPPSAMPYTSKNITFKALPVVGGTTWQDKMGVVFRAPQIIRTIRSGLRQSDYFQFRAPTGIGVYVIPYLMFFTSQKGWYKYAGNWNQKGAPLAYRFQKWLLEHQSRPVTINGYWDDLPKQCLPFENPCLTEQNILDGQATILQKTFDYPLDFCFVGRLEAAKGVDLILQSISNLDQEARKKIGTIHFVGDGSRMDYYKEQTLTLGLPIKFYGYLSRDAVHAIYKMSHAIILPSASEGFPKVIAEALNFGCIPIVSNVSSISHYIQDGVNGFLMQQVDVSSLLVCIHDFLHLTPEACYAMRSVSMDAMHRFSYSYYNERLLDHVL